MIYLSTPPLKMRKIQMFKKKKDDTFVILKVIMNVSLSLNNFDWEAVVFFLFSQL